MLFANGSENGVRDVYPCTGFRELRNGRNRNPLP